MEKAKVDSYTNAFGDLITEVITPDGKRWFYFKGSWVEVEGEGQ